MLGADGGIGVTDSLLDAVQPAARCVHVARVSVRVCECLGRAPRGRLGRPGDFPLEMGRARGLPREVELCPALQPRPSGKDWATAGPEAFAFEEGPVLRRRRVLAPGCASTWILI